MRHGGSLCALLLVAFLGTACNAPSATGPEAPEGLPAAATESVRAPEATAAATPTRAPISQITPAVVVEATELLPTPTFPGLTLPLPIERLAIVEPGPGSQVRSPIRIVGRGGPSRSERVRVRLLGEDGRVVAQRTTFLYAFAGQTGPIYTELAFDIPSVAEEARLEVATDDPRTGRLGHLATVNLVLLSTGEPLVYPAIDGPEQLTIFTPRPDSGVAGGVLHVDGAGWTMVEQPITVALLGQGGDTIASEDIWLDPRGVGVTGVFAVDLSYTVPYSQYGLIVLYEPAPDGSDYLHYTSLEIYLRP
jgi:hypothetical protein